MISVPGVLTDPSTGQQLMVTSIETLRADIEEDVKQACSEFNSQPDWGKNMELVDKLNRSPYLAQFAIRAIRLQLKTKNPEIEILALTLTEAIVKNVPASHAAVSQADFMRYLVKVGLNQRKDNAFKAFHKKFIKREITVNETHLRAQTIDKALMLVKMLAEAYEGNDAYPVFQDTYQQLLREGVRFPAPTADESNIVFTPQQTTAPPSYPNAMGSVPATHMAPVGASVPAVSHIVDRSLPMIRPVVLNPDVTDPNLRNAMENAQVLFETMNNDADGMMADLVAELVRAVKVQQNAVLMSIQNPSISESVMMQSIATNEVLLNVLEDYDKLVSGRARRYEEAIDVRAISEDNIQEEASLELAESDLIGVGGSEAKQSDPPREETPPPLPIAEPPSANRKHSRAASRPAAVNSSGDDLFDLLSSPIPSAQPQPQPQPVPVAAAPAAAPSFDPLDIFGAPPSTGGEASHSISPSPAAVAQPTQPVRPVQPMQPMQPIQPVQPMVQRPVSQPPPASDPFAGFDTLGDPFAAMTLGGPPVAAQSAPIQQLVQPTPQPFQPMPTQPTQPVAIQPFVAAQPVPRPQPQVQPFQPKPAPAVQTQPAANPFDLLGGDPFAEMGIPPQPAQPTRPAQPVQPAQVNVAQANTANPFDALSPNSQAKAKKQQAFLSDRDPFADFM